MITRGPLNNAHNTREVTCEYTRVDTREDNYIVFYARETLHIYISTHLVCSEVNIFARIRLIHARIIKYVFFENVLWKFSSCRFQTEREMKHNIGVTFGTIGKQECSFSMNEEVQFNSLTACP